MCSLPCDGGWPKNPVRKRRWHVYFEVSWTLFNGIQPNVKTYGYAYLCARISCHLSTFSNKHIGLCGPHPTLSRSGAGSDRRIGSAGLRLSSRFWSGYLGPSVLCNPHQLHFRFILLHVLDTVDPFPTFVYVLSPNQRTIVNQRYFPDRFIAKFPARFTTVQ